MTKEEALEAMSESTHGIALGSWAQEVGQVFGVEIKLKSPDFYRKQGAQVTADEPCCSMFDLIRQVGTGLGIELEAPFIGRGSNARHQVDQIRQAIKADNTGRKAASNALTAMNKAMAQFLK